MLLNSAIKRRLSAISRTKKKNHHFFQGIHMSWPRRLCTFPNEGWVVYHSHCAGGDKVLFYTQGYAECQGNSIHASHVLMLPYIFRVLCKHYVKPWVVSSTKILYGSIRVITAQISVSKWPEIISTSASKAAQGWLVGILMVSQHSAGTVSNLLISFENEGPHSDSALQPVTCAASPACFSRCGLSSISAIRSTGEMQHLSLRGRPGELTACEQDPSRSNVHVKVWGVLLWQK